MKMKVSDPFFATCITSMVVIAAAICYGAVVGKEIILDDKDWVCTAHHDVVTNGPVLGRALELKVQTVRICDQWSRK
jgi:hypothetical protein